MMHFETILSLIVNFSLESGVRFRIHLLGSPSISEMEVSIAALLNIIPSFSYDSAISNPCSSVSLAA
jgi:hypothetical protein